SQRSVMSTPRSNSSAQPLTADVVLLRMVMAPTKPVPQSSVLARVTLTPPFHDGAGEDSSSRMVATPRVSAMGALVALDRLTNRVSFASFSASPMIGTETVLVVWPGAKVSVPLLAV